MTEMNKINEEALEEVAGGKTRRVHNDAVPYAHIRSNPGLDSRIYFDISNGNTVETTGKVVHRDGYDWYQIRLAGAYDYGWIAGSLIGY